MRAIRQERLEFARARPDLEAESGESSRVWIAIADGGANCTKGLFGCAGSWRNTPNSISSTAARNDWARWS
jgi:hypothetical protein